MALGFVQEKISYIVERKAKYAAERISREYCREVVRTRERIIEDWFFAAKGVKFNYEGLIASDSNRCISSHSFKRFKGNISFVSYTVPDNFKKKRSAERWLAKQQEEGKSLDNVRPSNEYVMDLLFDDGIIGLPQRATMIPSYTAPPNWINGVNTKFYKQIPLGMYINNDENPRWKRLVEEIEESFFNYFDEKE